MLTSRITEGEKRNF